MDCIKITQKILEFHQNAIIQWKEEGIHLSQKNLLQWIEENHAFNYQLWHAEDKARREDKGHTFVYQAKRDIDYFNQQRNDRVERIDEELFQSLKPASPEVCALNSETPGMMIDRLSILSLKIYHMALQKDRKEVDDMHRNACHKKFETLILQRDRLGNCLEILLKEIQERTRTFCVYHQFKMYNDPALNPELYAHDIIL